MTTYLNITDQLSEYEKNIRHFVSLLDSEKEFFRITPERILKSIQVIIARKGSEISGIAGLERKYFFSLAYVIVKEKYQGTIIGARLQIKNIEESKKIKNIIYGVIEEKNFKSITFNRKLGIQNIGKRGKLCYYALPFNWKGNTLFYIIKVLFLFRNLSDLIKRYLRLIGNTVYQISNETEKSR